MPEPPPLDILLLAQVSFENAQTVIDHLFSFSEFSRHRVFTLGWMGGLPPGVDIQRFDVLVFHYSAVLALESYIPRAEREQIRDFQGLKVAFRQDEYQKVDPFHDALNELGIDLLYTCIPPLCMEGVYPRAKLPRLTLRNTLTGYVPQSLVHHPRRPIGERPVHIGYRSRSAPFWYGDLAREKIVIAEVFLAACAGTPVTTDIDVTENGRLYCKDWADFLGGCRCILGTESGASVIDFNGELEAQWAELTSGKLNCEGVDLCTYEEYRDRYLGGRQEIYPMHQISPRAFEAAAMGTALVLYEGAYSGILEPWRHFVPVKKDGSNLPEVLAFVQDTAKLQEMADVTWREVACNPAHGYARFVQGFDGDLDELFGARARTVRPYGREEWAALVDEAGYVDVVDWLRREKEGEVGYRRPFDLSALPCRYGKIFDRAAQRPVAAPVPVPASAGEADPGAREPSAGSGEERAPSSTGVMSRLLKLLGVRR